MITVKDLHKTYGRGTTATEALKGIKLEIKSGEFVAVMGRSGSGKSTLLHILGLLDKPTKGEICIDGKDTMQLSEEQKKILLEGRNPDGAALNGFGELFHACCILRSYGVSIDVQYRDGHNVLSFLFPYDKGEDRERAEGEDAGVRATMSRFGEVLPMI